MFSARFGKYLFIFGRTRSSDAVLIQSGFITDLAPHCRPASLHIVDPGARQIVVSPRFLWNLIRLARRHSRQGSIVGAHVRQVRAKVAIAYDNIPELFEWAEALPVPLIVVQHGMRQLADEVCFVDEPSDVVFLSWGKLQIDEFANGYTARYPNSCYRRKPREIHPIGSLRDSMYRSLNKIPKVDANQICLISQFKGIEGLGLTMPRERQLNLDRTAEYTNRYAQERNLKVLVALYSDTTDALRIEKDWYLEKFGKNCVFNDPSEEFATYIATDESIVSIGVHTSVLWEAFGKGKRILAYNFTGDKVFEFPVPGPWYLAQGSYKDFANRIDALRGMSDSEYLTICGDWPNYLISYSPENPTHLAISKVIMGIVNQGRGE